SLPWARRDLQLLDLGDGCVLAYGGHDGTSRAQDIAVLHGDSWRPLPSLFEDDADVRELVTLGGDRLLALDRHGVLRCIDRQGAHGAVTLLPWSSQLQLPNGIEPGQARLLVAASRVLLQAHEREGTTRLRTRAWTLPSLDVPAPATSSWDLGPDLADPDPADESWPALPMPEVGDLELMVVDADLLALGQSRTWFGTRRLPSRGSKSDPPAALLTAIHQTDDDAPWQVLADWLVGHGIARGEQIMLELARAHADQGADQDARLAIDQALARIRSPHMAWLGADGRFTSDTVELMHALLRAPLSQSHRDAPRFDTLLREIAELTPDRLQLRWHRGFIVAAEIHSFDLPQELGARLPSPLALVLHAPASLLLRELALDIPVGRMEARHFDQGRPMLARFLTQLDRAPQVPPIASLRIGPREVPHRFLATPTWTADRRTRGPRWEPPNTHHVGSLAALSPLADELRELTITGNGILPVPTRFPKLEVLRLRSADLSGAALQALSACSFPVLRELELWLGRDHAHSNVRNRVVRQQYAQIGRQPPEPHLHGLQALLSAVNLPALRRLGLHNDPNIDVLILGLLRPELMQRLERLDLSDNLMSDGGAHTLIEARERLAGLDKLVLRNNLIGRRAARELERLLGDQVEVGPQRSPRAPRVF
ncbi:MAG: hypothetical protein KC457_04025, partial [Myxococcales bacterium]|nr:hypothetical protein [Myxococcales bacterium]